MRPLDIVKERREGQSPIYLMIFKPFFNSEILFSNKLLLEVPIYHSDKTRTGVAEGRRGMGTRPSCLLRLSSDSGVKCTNETSELDERLHTREP